MEESVSVVLYLAVVAAFEVLVLLSLFVSLYRKGCKELLNQIRQLLSSLYSLLGCGKTVKEQKINQGRGWDYVGTCGGRQLLLHLTPPGP